MRPVGVLILVALGASGCTAAPGGPAVGAERGACGANASCDDGLECWSARCVRPPPADCRAVGDRLASLTLGNYATREEREPLVAKWAAACTSARLSQREGRCLVEAPSEDELAACPRPLVPELIGDPKGCARLGERAAELLATAAGGGGRLRPILNVLDEVPAAVTALCVDDRWAPAAKTCLRDADDFAAAEQCLQLLDSGDRRAVERALVALVKRGGLRRPVKPPPRTGSGDDPWE